MAKMRRASFLAAALSLTLVSVLMSQEAGAPQMAKPLNQFTIGDLFPKIDAGLEQTAGTWKTASAELQTKTAARQKAVVDGTAAVKVRMDQLKAEAKAAKASKDFTAQGTAEGKLQTEEVVNKVLARLNALATEQRETADAWNRLANAMNSYVAADKEFDTYRSKGIAKPEAGAAGDNRLDQAGVQAFQKHTMAMDELGKGFAELGAQISGMSSDRQKFLSELQKGGHVQPAPPK